MTRQEFIHQYKLENPETIAKLYELEKTEEAVDSRIGNDYNKGNWLAMALRNLRPEQCYSKDDKGMGRLFADVFQDHCRYNVTAKQWFVYDGTVWKSDPEDMQVKQYAKMLSDALLEYYLTLPEGDGKSSFLKVISKYGNYGHREIMVKDAKDEYFLCQDELDSKLEFFNCQNGTYNLNTGEFKLHEPGDLLAKCSNVIYNPQAKSELFETFISEVMQGDQEKIDYLQKVFGYALTAETHLECCWILYGATTRNGKSTLVETLAYMMGNSDGYAVTMSPETLAQKKNRDSRQANGDIARLCGCRFLSTSEPPKNMLLDEAQLKNMTGRDILVARHMYQREFEFVPYFKLFMNTNYLPHIYDDTLFTSGRIVVVPFERHFSAQEQDKTLKDRLRTPENISGIFNWCLEGLRRFRREGLALTESMKTAIKEYRKKSDKIGNFMEDCMKKTGKNSKGGDVYQRYSSWCHENGHLCESKPNFFDDLKRRGILASSGTVNGKTQCNVVKGYELLPNECQCDNLPF